MGLKLKHPLLLSDFNKTQIFRKNPNTKFDGNHSIDSRVIQADGQRTGGQIDGHDGVNGHFSQFRQ
jgi:hypothetical protein